jgi:uncharacterized protein YndB with AHSA1/START domain
MTDDDTSSKRVYQVLIDAPIDKVWSELVKQDEALPFFFGAVCDCDDMRVGAPFAMRSTNGKHTSVVGEVLEFTPPHRYAHTFKFTSYDDAPCTVTYELEETPQGVEFSLITENTPPGSKTEKSMDQGGHFIVQNLKAVVETGKPTLGGRLILAMIGLSQPFSPKRTRSELWPLNARGAANHALHATRATSTK